MTLAERRVQLTTDLQTAVAQRDRLQGSLVETTRLIERMTGALALLDEMQQAEQETKPEETANG
jgi:hypothetical protein